jgi:type IV secretion system protein VirD4
VPSVAAPIRAGEDSGRVAVGVGACCGLALAVWATGEVGGFLMGGGWPHVTPTRAGALLVGVLSHPGRPASAWPPPLGHVVPDGVAFYLLLGALTVVAAGITASGFWLWGRAKEVVTRPRQAASGAAWARGRDLIPLSVSAPVGGRLLLGRAGRRLLAAESHQSVIVVGPTQTMKTTGFAVPALLEWQGPVLATSVKSDLVRDTLAWRSGQGRVWLYDPTASSGLADSGWSPLAGARTWTGARRTASALCSTARSGGDHLGDADFWYATAAKLLAPLLFAAAISHRDMAQVVEWVDTQESSEVHALLDASDVPDALRAAEATWARDERQLSSVYTTAETVLEAFADPDVSASASRAEIDPTTFLDGGDNTLYVCAPAHEQQRLRSIFVTLVSQVLASAYEQVQREGRPLSRPLLVVLDEAANIAPLAELDTIAATAAGHGIQLVTVWQDMAQIAARYGPRSATVVNNHRAKVVLSGISDPTTLEHVSALVGDEELYTASTTTDAGGARSTTESLTSRRLAPADSLRRIRPGGGVLVYGHLPPARLDLRPWFRDKELTRRARPGPRPG